MNRISWLVLGGVVLAALGIALLLWGFARQSSLPGLDAGGERAADVDPTSLSIYTNGTYGFSLFYPVTGTAEDSFTEETTFPWRAGASAEGTPIVRISTRGGEVRIGASTEPRELAACLEAGQAEESRGTVTIGGREWHTFVFEALGTEDERRVASHRLVQEGACFAVEAFDRVGAADVAPTERVEFIIENFTFAR